MGCGRQNYPEQVTSPHCRRQIPAPVIMLERTDQVCRAVLFLKWVGYRDEGGWQELSHPHTLSFIREGLQIPQSNSLIAAFYLKQR